MGGLITAIAIQWLCVFSMFGLPQVMCSGNPSFCSALLFIFILCAFPFIFGPIALYGLIKGLQIKSRKVVVLSVLCGIGSVFSCILSVLL